MEFCSAAWNNTLNLGQNIEPNKGFHGRAHTLIPLYEVQEKRKGSSMLTEVRSSGCAEGGGINQGERGGRSLLGIREDFSVWV